MKQYDYNEVITMQIILCSVDIFMQGIILVIYKTREKFFIMSRQVLVILFYFSKIIGDIVSISVAASSYDITDSYEQIRKITDLEIVKVFCSKSIPSGILSLLCATSFSLLFKQKTQRVVKGTVLVIVSIIILNELAMIVTAIIRNPHPTLDSIAKLNHVMFYVDLGYSGIFIISVVILFAGIWGRRRDYLLLDCLNKVYMHAKYEIALYSVYIISTAIHFGSRLVFDFGLYFYQPFVVYDSLFQIIYGLLFGLVFIPPTTFQKRLEKKEIEMMSVQDRTEIGLDDEISLL
ncbi:Hypothetical_protein [Hexamita inflata]|uniref:Hypothetical_protein n=1 Tax=Hexamita inflata TaxID=28002 RepID=A0AA86U201_9EUKA|nr:Hypothetical protein HINF_LOCUS24706 [Hexamita inflata]